MDSSRPTWVRRSSKRSCRSRSATATFAPTRPSCSGCSRAAPRRHARRRSRRSSRCTTEWGSSRARRAASSELLDLAVCELAPLAGLKSLDAEACVDAPVQPADAVTDGLAHPAHLTVAPFVEDELEPGGAEPTHACRRGHAVLELDALRERPQRLVVRLLPGLDLVDLLDPVTRVCEPVCERAVVRQQQRAGRVDVEAAYRHDTELVVDEADHRGAPLRVARGRDDAGRLV